MKPFLKRIYTPVLLAFSFFFFLQSATFAAAPSNGSWTTTGSMASKRIYATATLLQNGKVLVAGGTTNGTYPSVNTLIASTELYDPSTGTWSNTGTPLESRRDASLILLNDGRVLTAGGATGGLPATILATSEVYDPTNATWSHTANNLAQIRAGANMIKLQDGRVLLLGGSNYSGCISDAEIFDPTTNTWSSAGTMPWGGVSLTTTLLADGRVFVAGGQCGDNIINTAIYDPTTNTWTSTASLPVASASISFLLNNGKVLVRTGDPNPGNPATQPVDETYDPGANTWTVDSTTLPFADRGTYTQLTNGNVLAMGGWSCDPTNPSCTLATAELFTTVNHPPVVNSITVATSPVQVNNSITASATFTDADTTDTHTASWNWGDGNTTTGTVTESSGSGSVSNTHTYTATGVYPVTLTVTDNHGATGTSTYQYVVVYDPSAGWIKGDKEFTSPVGAVTGNLSATGKASFGFQVKYTNGSMVPSGKNVSLSFPTGNIDFASTSYQWLVVSGSKATFKANGTFNGASGYTLLVSAIDNGNGNATDFVRFQIKDSGGNVVYDTQPGAGDTADPTTAVTKGKITVH